MTEERSSRLAESPPAISIVLPTHNGSRYLDQSIKSVLDQSLSDWELIVVNDASTDNTRDLVDCWAARDPRVRAIHLSQNRKLPGALNDGFRQARGQLHTWTSDDNWYHPQALARMREVLNANPRVAVVFSDMFHVDEYGRFLELAEAGSAETLYQMNQIGACFLYRSEVTSALGGYDEHLFGAEDYDFWLRASLQFQFQRLPQALYSYRFQPGSLTARRSRMIATHVELAVRRWLEQAKWQSRSGRSRAYLEWGVRCLRANTWETVFVPWLHSADWLDDQEKSTLRREALKRTTHLAWEAHWRRDWREFDRLVALLDEVRGEPAVASFLAKRFYPRWVYGIKDQLKSVRDRVRALQWQPTSFEKIDSTPN